MNIQIIKDKIKSGSVEYKVGDEVICFHRKSNGHPRSIKDGVTYIIRNIDPDGHITVAQHSTDGIGFLQSIRVHKMYLISKPILRDIKLNSLFSETKLN